MSVKVIEQSKASFIVSQKVIELSGTSRQGNTCEFLQCSTLEGEPNFCGARGQWLQPPLGTLSLLDLWDKDLKFKLMRATKTKGPVRKAYNLIYQLTDC